MYLSIKPTLHATNDNTDGRIMVSGIARRRASVGSIPRVMRLIV